MSVGTVRVTKTDSAKLQARLSSSEAIPRGRWTRRWSAEHGRYLYYETARPSALGLPSPPPDAVVDAPATARPSRIAARPPIEPPKITSKITPRGVRKKWGG